MKKLFFWLRVIVWAFPSEAECPINPMICYTPITLISQAVQNAVNFQALSTQVPIPETSSSSTTSPIPVAVAPTTVGSTGQIFQSEGYYQLENPLTYSGSNSLFTIASSHVTLDLNGQSISYAGTPSEPVNGIVIHAGVTDITIRNGTIVGFPGTGILSQGTAESPIVHLTLDHVKIVSCTQGMIVCNTHNTTVTNCAITHTTNTSGTAYGMMFINNVGVTIQNCCSQNNTSANGNCYGYALMHCKTAFLDHCAASGNEGAQESAGIYFYNMIKNNYIQNCSFNGNSSTGSCACGILIDNSNQTYVQDSSAQINLSEAYGFFGYGIRLRNSSNCFIKNNTIDGNDYGIYDDETAEQNTNMYTQNIAYQNNYNDYLRPNSSPLMFIQVQQEYLQGILAAGKLDNISIRISS